MRPHLPSSSRSLSSSSYGYGELEEAQQYIAHLEAELEAAQTARDELPRLTAQVKELSTLLAEWETQYGERVEELAAEAERVKTLESELEYSKLREAELERSLDSAHHTIDAAEAGNSQLEKRLEIMSDLLAQSPTKLDLHIGPRHGRQRSLAHLPKLPTAAALMSPTRPSASGAPGMGMSSPQRMSCGFPFPASSPPDLVQTQTQQQHHEPTRRMRRFGGGSMGPKPLILPSTSHHEPAPPSPVDSMERNDSAYQSSAGDQPHRSPLEEPFQLSSSPSPSRRPSDTPDPKPREQLGGVGTLSERRDSSTSSSLQSALDFASSPRATVTATPKRPKNLMEELRDFHSPDFWSSSPPPTSTRVTSRHVSVHVSQTPRTPSPTERRKNAVVSTPLGVLQQAISSTPSSAASSTICHSRPESQLSRIDALGLFFGNFFRTHRAASGEISTIQWWLVGTIIGVCAISAARLKRVLE